MLCQWIVLGLCLAVVNAGFYGKKKADKSSDTSKALDIQSLCNPARWTPHKDNEFMFFGYVHTLKDAISACSKCQASVPNINNYGDKMFIMSVTYYPVWYLGDEKSDGARGKSVVCKRPKNRPAATTAAPVSPYQRTVIMLEKNTDHGDYIFFRGGIDHNRRKGCTYNADTSNCSIPIYVRYADLNISAAYNAWRAGDRHLDWYGKEEGQGVFGTWQPEGSPGLWTTNDTSDTLRYHPLNSFGPHYWMLDMDMDCSKTMDGLFEFKAYITNGDGWEWNINNNQCEGSTQTLNSYNHVAKCGALNVFHWNLGSCQYLKL